MSHRSAFPWTLGATVLLSAGGFLFWMLVARRLSEDAVGAGASLFSIAFFLVYATNLGVPILVTRFATDVSPRSAAITAISFIATAVSGAIGAVLFVLVAPADVLEVLGGRGLRAVVVMVLLVVAVSLSSVVDARLVAMLRLRQHFARFTAITIIRLAGIPLIPSSDDGRIVFIVATWAFGATSLVFIPSLLRSSRSGRRAFAEVLPDRARLARFSLTNYLGQVALQGPVFLTPVMVLIAVTSEEYSDFYLAWGVASVLLMISQVLGQTLLAEASNRGRSDSRTLLAAGIGVSLAIVAAVVTVPLGRWLASTLYGERYATVGDLLPWLMVGCGPATIVTIVVSEARYAQRNRTVLLTSVPFALIVATAVGLGAQLDGAHGASVGWLVGNVISIVPSGFQLAALRSASNDGAPRSGLAPSSNAAT